MADTRPRAQLAGLIFPSTDDPGRVAILFPHDASTPEDTARKVLRVRGLRHDTHKPYDILMAAPYGYQWPRQTAGAA